MKRTGHLFETIISFRNLYSASKKALKGKKYNPGQSAFYFDLENELIALETELKKGEYQPRPYRRFEIFEPKRRHICAADIRDRVVHHAICKIIEPLFDRTLIFDTYACRKNKGGHAAIKRMQTFSRRFSYFCKCDIRHYFETMDHDVLKSVISRKIKDKQLNDLLWRIIDHRVPGNPPGKGVPIGNLTSQVFANLYLGELDHFIKERCCVKGYGRYMDDFILFGDDKYELKGHLAKIEKFAGTKLKLDIKNEETMIGPVHIGIPFLGFRIYPGTTRLKRANLVRFRRNIRKRMNEYFSGQIDEDFLTASVRSMIAHISHADTYNARKSMFFEFNIM